jgi:hypothetical protein
MFVHPSRLLAQGTITLLGFAIGACDAPVANTDLRPDGDPEVLTVMLFNDAENGVLEGATFCKVNDNKRPGLVNVTSVGLSEQVCDEDLAMPATEVTDAIPTAWHARVMFDELLDPDVEALVEILDPTSGMGTGIFEGHIKDTKPVTIKCNNVDVPYDGYYDPSGNNVTWPVGPSLFIQPTALQDIPTGAECVLTINDSVVDKDGNKVPTGQAADPNYKWQVAALELTATDPAAPAPGDPAPAIAAADGVVALTFNGFIDAASLDPAEVSIKEGADCTAAATGTTKTPAVADAGDGQSVVISTNWVAGKAYVVTFNAGAAVADLAGGALTLTPLDLCVTAE